MNEQGIPPVSQQNRPPLLPRGTTKLFIRDHGTPFGSR
jgi:hypothetical protein